MNLIGILLSDSVGATPIDYRRYVRSYSTGLLPRNMVSKNICTQVKNSLIPTEDHFNEVWKRLDDKSRTVLVITSILWLGGIVGGKI